MRIIVVIITALTISLLIPVHSAFAYGGGGGGGSEGGGTDASTQTGDPSEPPPGIKGLTAEQNKALENFLARWLRGELTPQVKDPGPILSTKGPPPPAWQANPRTVMRASRPGITDKMWNAMTPQQQAEFLNAMYNASRAVQRASNLTMSHLASKGGPPGKAIAVGYGGLSSGAGAIAEGERDPKAILEAAGKGGATSLVTLPFSPVAGEGIGEGLNNPSWVSSAFSVNNSGQPPEWAAPPPATYHGTTLHH